MTFFESHKNPLALAMGSVNGEGMSQAERLAKLNAIAISQMEILTQDHRIEALASHTGELSPQD